MKSRPFHFHVLGSFFVVFVVTNSGAFAATHSAIVYESSGSCDEADHKTPIVADSDCGEYTDGKMAGSALLDGICHSLSLDYDDAYNGTFYWGCTYSKRFLTRVAKKPANAGAIYDGHDTYCQYMQSTVTSSTDCSKVSNELRTSSLSIENQCFTLDIRRARRACYYIQSYTGSAQIFLNGGKCDQVYDPSEVISINSQTVCSQVPKKDSLAWDIQIRGLCLDIASPLSVQEACERLKLNQLP